MSAAEPDARSASAPDLPRVDLGQESAAAVQQGLRPDGRARLHHLVLEAKLAQGAQCVANEIDAGPVRRPTRRAFDDVWLDAQASHGKRQRGTRHPPTHDQDACVHLASLLCVGRAEAPY